MHSVILTELGIAIFDDNKCVKSIPFKDPAKEFVELKKEKAEISELVQFVDDLKQSVSVNDMALLRMLKKESIDAETMEEKKIEIIQSSKLRVLVDSGFAKDEKDAREKLREFAIQLSSSRVTEISESPDLHVIQAINSLDETDKIINLLSARLREWYGLHFPELDNLIDTISGYCKIVVAGRRDDLNQKIYLDAGFPEEKSEMLSLIQGKSRGGKISDDNLIIVQSLAKQVLELFDLRTNLERHIENQMQTIAPNLSGILGASLGARILGRAGSLKRLASMPASTIQVLGAEKALFRSLKTGSYPPKHGLLFQHALVHSAPRWQRGKIARAIAAKAALASRVDVYGGGKNEVLFEKLNIRISEIGEKYKEPPEKPVTIPQRRFPDRKRFNRGDFVKQREKKSDWKKSKRRKFGKRRR